MPEGSTAGTDKKSSYFLFIARKTYQRKTELFEFSRLRTGKGENKKRRKSVNAIGFVRVVFTNPVFLPVFKDF